MIHVATLTNEMDFASDLINKDTCLEKYFDLTKNKLGLVMKVFEKEA